MSDWRKRISIDPGICHGKACFRNTRVLVSSVLDNLAEGVDADDILAAYPALEAEDIRAALAYAAELARERTVELAQAA
jgi:uncharacterized protein (DUF433 family)